MCASPHSTAPPSVPSHNASALANSGRGCGFLNGCSRGRVFGEGRDRDCDDRYCVRCEEIIIGLIGVGKNLENPHRLMKPNMKLITPLPPLLCLLLHMVNLSCRDMSTIHCCNNLIS